MVLLPPEFLNSVVAIGLDTNHDKWVATGFIYGYLRERIDEDNGNFSMYLVTNRHVIENALDEGQKHILIKLNHKDGKSFKDIAVDLLDDNGEYNFMYHPDKNIDVAVLSVDYSNLEQEKEIQFIPSFRQTLTINEIKEENNIGEGDFVFVLGFPMGIVGVKRKSTIVRSGCIARINDLLNGENNEFLIDALVFPGNSGGPVFLRPSMYSIGKTTVKQSFLIGMVKEYIPYYDNAYSSQTGNLRVSFEDNSGLTSVIPMDYINETIKAHLLGESDK
jgi:S1-C subfamily serine protease